MLKTLPRAFLPEFLLSPSDRMVAVTSDLRQSTGWAKFLSSQGWEVADIDTNGKKAKAYVRKIPFLGSVVKIQRPLTVPSAKNINQFAKKHRALFVKLEPPLTQDSTALNKNGFEPDPSPNLPTKTIWLDLTEGHEDLWRRLSKDPRQSIRKTVGKLEIKDFKFGEKEFNKQLAHFYGLLAESGKRGGFWPTPLKELNQKSRAFGEDALLFLVFSSNQPLAGGLLFMAGETAFFHSIGSSREGQKKYAPYFLVWEIIKRLKVKYLDLEGIADPRFPQTKKWEGFTIFKRKWGGKEISYPKPLIKFYRWPIKLIFKIGELL